MAYYKVLLADDEKEIRQGIIQKIDWEANGFILAGDASNGREALEQFERKGEGYYDLIFMDVQMPIMDGYEASRAIRSINRKDALTIPIIAMTANAFSEDVIASKRAGMNEHIPKPLDVEQLVSCMKRWLDGQ